MFSGAVTHRAQMLFAVDRGFSRYLERCRYRRRRRWPCMRADADVSKPGAQRPCQGCYGEPQACMHTSHVLQNSQHSLVPLKVMRHSATLSPGGQLASDRLHALPDACLGLCWTAPPACVSGPSRTWWTAWCSWGWTPPAPQALDAHQWWSTPPGCPLGRCEHSRHAQPCSRAHPCSHARCDSGHVGTDTS